MKKERKLPKDGRFALEKLKTSVNIGFRDLVNNPKVASLFSIVKQPEDQFDEQGYYVSFGPLLGGNCQFSSICCILREFGFQQSTEELTAEMASKLEAYPNDLDDAPLDFYIDIPFSNYLNRMSINRTFGDEITSRAAAELFNSKFFIISSLGRAAEEIITPQNVALQGLVY